MFVFLRSRWDGYVPAVLQTWHFCWIQTPEPVYRTIASNMIVLSTLFHILMCVFSCFVIFTLLLDCEKTSYGYNVYSLFALRTVTCFRICLFQGHMLTIIIIIFIDELYLASFINYRLLTANSSLLSTVKIVKIIRSN